jgi:hypothetical protein
MMEVTAQENVMKVLRPEQVAAFPAIRDLTAEELAEAYKLSREAFTAADLQKYAETDVGVPAEDVLQEMEEQQKQFDAERHQS